VKASVANHGPGGAVEDGGRLRTMWPMTTWWNLRNTFYIAWTVVMSFGPACPEWGAREARDSS
jgi:hypothetical protein